MAFQEIRDAEKARDLREAGLLWFQWAASDRDPIHIKASRVSIDYQRDLMSTHRYYILLEEELVIEIIDTFEVADNFYKRGKLYVWTVCPEELSNDPNEYYEPHWHPVTELPEWGPNHFRKYTCGARL